MKVVSLTGEPLGSPHEPDENVAKFLREMLEAVESGEVNGLCIAIRYADGAYSHGMSGAVGDYGMIGALEASKARVLAMLTEDDE